MKFFQYPAESKLNATSVYLEEITSRLNNIDYLKRKYEYRSVLNINTISVNTIKSNLKLILAKYLKVFPGIINS